MKKNIFNSKKMFVKRQNYVICKFVDLFVNKDVMT